MSNSRKPGARKPGVFVRGSISDSWRSFLGEMKLGDCRTIVGGDIGKPFKTKATSGSEVYRFTHSSGRTVYVKRYDGLSITRAIKRLLKFRWPHTSAFYEFRMAQILEEAGFDVMEPIAWAEHCRMGFVPVRGG